MGWVDSRLANNSLQQTDILELEKELSAVGPDYEHRRAAAVVGLTMAGQIDSVANKTDHKGEPETFRTTSALDRDDDRYIRRLLPHWNQLVEAFGGEEKTLQRLGLTPEMTLSVIMPGIENVNRLFKIMIDKAPTAQHVHMRDLLGAAERFEPSGEFTRKLIMRLIVEEPQIHGFGTQCDYWACLIAAEVFAEYFSDDTDLVERVVASFTNAPSSYPAAAALAELCLRQPNPDLLDLIREKASGQRYDTATHFKLIAALSKPEIVKDALHQVLREDVYDWNEYQLARWVPAILRRINKDEELKNELLADVAPTSSASVQVSFTALVCRAGGTTDKLRAFAISELKRLKQQQTSVVGFDLVSGSHRQAAHVFAELLQ